MPETPHPDEDDVEYILGANRSMVGGSARYACFKCLADVWLAPSGQDRIRRNLRIKVLCEDCFMPMMRAAKNPDIVFPNRTDLVRDVGESAADAILAWMHRDANK